MWNLLPNLQSYFGHTPGGPDLRRAIGALPIEWMERFGRAVGGMSDGRVIFMGNGGSFDNARLMAALCRARGITAKTPGHPDDYLTTALGGGYAKIFTHGLEQDDLNPRDVVVGISGSGNSENIIAALQYARVCGASTFCMGGRTGGKMRLVCGEPDSLIVASDCMEAIEDLHGIALLLVLAARDQKVTIEQARSDFLRRFDLFLSDENLKKLSSMSAGLLDTAVHGGHAFILGTGIGAHHIRADLLRGATNTLPIRGLSAPECFTMNSAQATANDDGLDFLLADGLAKFRPGPRDFAVLCKSDRADPDGPEPMLDHCRDVLRAGGTPFTTVGRTGVDVSMFEPIGIDFATAMIGHAASFAIRETLQKLWAVRQLDVPADYPPGQKKHGVRQTLEMEKRFLAEHIIEPGEHVTFAYGNVYAARRPPEWPEERCYF